MKKKKKGCIIIATNLTQKQSKRQKKKSQEKELSQKLHPLLLGGLHSLQQPSNFSLHSHLHVVVITM